MFKRGDIVLNLYGCSPIVQSSLLNFVYYASDTFARDIIDELVAMGKASSNVTATLEIIRRLYAEMEDFNDRCCDILGDGRLSCGNIKEEQLAPPALYNTEKMLNDILTLLAGRKSEGGKKRDSKDMQSKSSIVNPNKRNSFEHNPNISTNHIGKSDPVRPLHPKDPKDQSLDNRFLPNNRDENKPGLPIHREPDSPHRSPRVSSRLKDSRIADKNSHQYPVDKNDTNHSGSYKPLPNEIIRPDYSPQPRKKEPDWMPQPEPKKSLYDPVNGKYEPTPLEDRKSINPYSGSLNQSQMDYYKKPEVRPSDPYDRNNPNEYRREYPSDNQSKSPKFERIYPKDQREIPNSRPVNPPLRDSDRSGYNRDSNYPRNNQRVPDSNPFKDKTPNPIFNDSTDAGGHTPQQPRNYRPGDSVSDRSSNPWDRSRDPQIPQYRRDQSPKPNDNFMKQDTLADRGWKPGEQPQPHLNPDSKFNRNSGDQNSNYPRDSEITDPFAHESFPTHQDIPQSQKNPWFPNNQNPSNKNKEGVQKVDPTPRLSSDTLTGKKSIDQGRGISRPEQPPYRNPSQPIQPSSREGDKGRYDPRVQIQPSRPADSGREDQRNRNDPRDQVQPYKPEDDNRLSRSGFGDDDKNTTPQQPIQPSKSQRLVSPFSRGDDDHNGNPGYPQTKPISPSFGRESNFDNRQDKPSTDPRNQDRPYSPIEYKPIDGQRYQQPVPSPHANDRGVPQQPQQHQYRPIEDNRYDPRQQRDPASPYRPIENASLKDKETQPLFYRFPEGRTLPNGHPQQPHKPMDSSWQPHSPQPSQGGKDGRPLSPIYNQPTPAAGQPIRRLDESYRQQDQPSSPTWPIQDQYKIHEKPGQGRPDQPRPGPFTPEKKDKSKYFTSEDEKTRRDENTPPRYRDPQEFPNWNKVSSATSASKKHPYPNGLDGGDIPTDKTTHLKIEIKDPAVAVVKNLRNKYGKPVREAIKVEGRPWRLAVSKSDARIYYGGNDFGYVTLEEVGGKDEGVIWNKKVLFIRDLGKNRFAAGFSNDFCLGIYDTTLTQLAYLPGAQRGGEWKGRVSVGSGEDVTRGAWIRGNSEVAVLDNETLSVSELKGFYDLPSTQDSIGRAIPSSPVASVCSGDGNIVCGLGMVSEVTYTLHIKTEATEVEVFRVSDFVNLPCQWQCLELSFENDLLWVGGTDTSRGRAIIFAMSIKPPFKRKALKIFESDTGFESVFCAKRHQSCNIFFLGMRKHLVIIYWSGQTIYLINQISIPGEKSISDIALDGEAIWLVNEGPEILGIGFGNSQARQQISSNTSAAKDLAALNQYIRIKNEELHKEEEEVDQQLNEDDQLVPGGDQGLLRYPRFVKEYTKFITRAINIPEGPISLIQSSPPNNLFAASRQMLFKLMNTDDSGGQYVITKPTYVSASCIRDLITVGEQVVMLEGHDIVRIETKDGSEVGRLKSPQSQLFSENEVLQIANNVYTGSNQAYLWQKSTDSVSIVHPETFAEQHLPEKIAKDMSYLRSYIVSPVSRNLLAALGSDIDEARFIFWDRKNEIVTDQRDYMPTDSIVTKLETSLDDRIVFAGGKNLATRSAIMCCLTFEARPTLLGKVELRGENGSKLQEVKSLRRWANRQVLIAGTESSVHIVEWTGRQFSVLNRIEGLLKGPVSSICIVESEARVFACSNDDHHISEITFIFE